jgi:pimeloyl-ACP methyl ester carboxylesterase
MKTIILLHGSWHGAWCWYKVTPLLQKMGYKVIVPDLPGRGKNTRCFTGLVSLAQMEREIVRLIDAEKDNVVIVVHSRNGILASRLGELRPNKIEKIVYLASFMLRPGERASDCFRDDRESLLRGAVMIDKLKLTDMIQKHVYKSALYADCSDEDIELAYALLTPEPSLPAITRLKLTEKNYGSVERYYIELTKDRAVTIELQRKLIARSPVKQVFSIDASHSAYFSKSNELVEIIDKIVKI